MIIIANIAIICILLYFLIKRYKNISNLIKVSLIMIISGGLSNLIDRLSRGYVVDYIDINQIFDYPVFNIADICVVIGVILLVGYIIVNIIKKQENESK
ncbi:MAG: signal peptidase II [Clostridia bacterium]